MKRVLMAAAFAGLLASGAVAADHSEMHNMMMKQGGLQPDDRVELKLPATMKAMQKNMMRKHLDTVSDITAALAVNDLDKAGAIARENLGWTPAEEQRCNKVSEITGEKDFASLGMAVHKKADELADAAKAGNRDKALEHLAALIKNCNSCHAKFRH
ncbi:MAG: cytochrome c [Deltaproteobacteria bacterium]|nr:cytochrome c [Deltaproteobacteria bacterium]